MTDALLGGNHRFSTTTGETTTGGSQTTAIRLG
jgi:hypothetical protein